MPKLSIITINLNNNAGLRETVESVLNQTYNDYEYIIIDGGSIDGSIETIKEYADRISYWVSEPDKGIYNGMNKGILQAKGEYLQFLNSGDLLVNETILSKVFEIKRTADIVYGHLNTVFDKKIRLHKAVKENQLSLAYFYNSTLSHPASFIARRLFDNCLYDESYSISADKLFFIENIISKNCTLQQINTTIANFNLVGISNNPKSQVILKEENDRIFTQTIPPRIAKDYEIILSVKNSPLLIYIVYLQRLKHKMKRILLNIIKMPISF